MNKVTVPEVKQYLGLDGGEQDKLLTVLLEAAERVLEKVLRRKLARRITGIEKTATLYVVWQLYFNRDNEEFKPAEIESTVAIMLSDLRENRF